WIWRANGALQHPCSGGVGNQFSHRGAAMLVVSAGRLLRDITAVLRRGEQSASATSSASSVIYRHFIRDRPPAVGRKCKGTGDQGYTRCGDVRRAGVAVCGDGTGGAWPLRPAPCFILRDGSLNAADDPANKHLTPGLCSVRNRVCRDFHCVDAGCKPESLLWSVATNAAIAPRCCQRGSEVSNRTWYRTSRRGYTI